MSRKSPVSPATSESATSFQFVNLKDPSDTKEPNVRRAIRSHVTKQQHQKAEQLAAARRSNSDPQLTTIKSEQNVQSRAHAASFPLSMPSISGQQSPIMPSGNMNIVGSSTQHSILDVSQIYPSEWLPYLNQTFENCA